MAGGLALALALGAAAEVVGQAADPPFTMSLGARLQVRYTLHVPGAEEQDAAGSFGVRRGRLSVGGAAYERFSYAVQLELAGASVQLLDASISTPIAPGARLWFGQGKAPFGRQQLTSSGSLHMVDRPITDGRFAPGRQVGVALFGQNQARTLEYGAGIYNGHGPRTANQNDRYMYVGRAVLTPLGAYPPAEGAFDYPATPRVALGVAAMHNTLGTGDALDDVVRLGLEGAFRVRGFNATAELYREQRSPAVGNRVDTDGWYVQGGYLLPDRRHELAARWAVIRPGTAANTDQTEVGVGYSLYFNAHRAKVQTDLRRLDSAALEWRDWQLRVQLQLAM